MANDSALIVIDIQRSLLDEGPWEVGRLLRNIDELVARARSAGAPVVFVRDTRVEPDGALHDGLDRRPDDLVLCKDFCDAFLGTRLDACLKNAGITRLVICGMQTDYCIDTSCRRAASLGYDVQLAADAHSTFDHEQLAAASIVGHHNRILRDFPAGAGRVRALPTQDVVFD